MTSKSMLVILQMGYWQHSSSKIIYNNDGPQAQNKFIIYRNTAFYSISQIPTLCVICNLLANKVLSTVYKK